MSSIVLKFCIFLNGNSSDALTTHEINFTNGGGPQINSINPSSIALLGSNRTLTISGRNFDEESYASLSSGYWFTLLVSGLLFMWAFGYLGWRTGIGWFFLSNLISVLLVRFDLAHNSSVLLWHEKKKERFISNLLN